MQQLPVTPWQHQQAEDQSSPSLVQRVVEWGKVALSHQPSNAAQFDDCDLDQRVRLSGEW